MEDSIDVEVVCGSAARQELVALKVTQGTTVREAIVLSGILGSFPEIDLDVIEVGIFSRKTAMSAVLSAHDRIEIYRPLEIDPKEARRQRAKK